MCTIMLTSVGSIENETMTVMNAIKTLRGSAVKWRVRLSLVGCSVSPSEKEKIHTFSICHNVNRKLPQRAYQILFV